MKVKELRETLTDLENQLKNLEGLRDFHDLNETYAKLKNESGYFFSESEPIDIYRIFEEMLSDIERIRDDIEDKVSAHAEDIEL